MELHGEGSALKEATPSSWFDFSFNLIDLACYCYLEKGNEERGSHDRLGLGESNDCVEGLFKMIYFWTFILFVLFIETYTQFVLSGIEIREW